MSHVFISYSKRNKDYARKLADHLIVSGFDVWIDDRIDYGSEWEEAIQNAIEVCAAFLIIMTPESRESKWVKRECQYAESQSKPQFPLLLSGDVFFRYGTTQYADVTNGSLPPDTFLGELAEHAPRKLGVGAHVTVPVVSAPKIISSPLPGSNTIRRVTSSRSALLLIGATVLVTLLIALIIILQGQQIGGETTCQNDWFFGNQDAMEGECPVSDTVEYDGLVQRFGGGWLIGFLIADTGDGRYFVLKNDGSYLDLLGDWDLSSVNVGECVGRSVPGFLSVPHEDSAAEVIGCPAEEFRVGTLNYQTGDSRSEFVVYIGTSEDEVFRFAAPSSRPGTDGEWQRIPAAAS